MKTVIRPETEMKDSGIEWVGVIPKEWSSIKGKYVYFVQAGYPFNSEHFSLIKGMPLIRIRDITSGKCETYFDGDYSDEYVVNNTDLLIGMDGDFNVRWWESGQAVLNQRCCRILEKNNISRKYLYYALPFSLKELNDLTYFTTVKHLSNNGILNLNFPFPPLSEQQTIADYLDETCSKIDEIIAEAKASIDEYKELKQSVIFEAVTKGLDKNVEMKDSGVEGMGFIPAKWQVVRFMKVNYVRARLGWKGLKAEEYVDVGYPFLAAYHIVNGHLCWENLNCITKERYDESPEIKLSIGDLVLVKDGAGIGKCARIDDMPLGEATVNSSLSVITPNKLLDYRYEYYYFMSPLFQNIIARLKNGMGVPHLTQESMKDIYLPLPSKNEQQAIADYLDNKMIGLDSLIAEKESLINDLEAYKKSLIYEVVTGKRKVV